MSSQHKKKHAFDLGNSTQLIECKYFNWTESNNNPSGKIATLNEAMLYFIAAPAGFHPVLHAIDRQREGGQVRAEAGILAANINEERLKKMRDGEVFQGN